MIKTRIVSSLEKVMPCGHVEDYARLGRISVLRGERLSLQLVCELVCHEEGNNFSVLMAPTIEGPLAPYATVREVRAVPSMNNGRATVDSDYITRSPALIPDVLKPLPYRGALVVPPYCLATLWIEIAIPEDCETVGETSLGITLVRKYPDPARVDPEPLTLREEITVEVINAVLPPQKLLFTQWFHSDCLADYYGVAKWSDEHFKILRRFAEVAKRRGFRMLFTPLVSPPLDNSYDTRDLQLADVTLKDGEYHFGWEKLDRYLAIVDEVGIEFLEIGHLFTQGGAVFATKVMGTVDGEYRRLFAKDTPCDDPEYTRFLRALLTSFLAHMKARGDDHRCYFHISDEPTREHLPTYLRAKATVADLLEGYPLMDALSHYEFYESGAVKKPIVLLDHLHEFVEHEVEGLWTYNCLAPDNGYSNRFIAMTSARNRSISLLLYKYSIEGFLHWGYNFYYNSGSADLINPFLDSASSDIFPSGDAFSVYPGHGGEPWESIRLLSFHEALQDLSAFALCESLYSRKEVLSLLEEELGAAINTRTYVNEAARMHAIRERINAMIRARV